MILPIDKVEDHPNADRLSLNHIRGYVAVSNKMDDGSHRYHAGQLVAYVPLNAVVPDSLLIRRGYWNEAKNKGFLGGASGNIVKPINLRGVLSQGLIFPTIQETFDSGVLSYIENGAGHKRLVTVGDDVTTFLDITKNETPYISSAFEASSVRYSVEDLKLYPNLLDGQQVIITELLHGILCVVGFDRTRNDPFVVLNGSNQYMVGDNIYTQTAKPIWEDIKRYLLQMPAVERFYIFGEIIGPGIQDITYGLENTEFRALDIQMGLMGGGRDSIPFGFLGVRKYELLKWLNISSAPILWGGQFDRNIVMQLTEGPASIGGGLRKGVVITSEDENPIEGKRPILKNISEKYLLRVKGTEYK